MVNLGESRLDLLHLLLVFHVRGTTTQLLDLFLVVQSISDIINGISFLQWLDGLVLAFLEVLTVSD